MKILITGASGMVGKNLLENEDILKYNLLCPDSKELNLLNSQDIDLFLNNNKPDLIIHAAGKVGGIQANIANPIQFYINNLDMGKNLVLAAYKNGINKILNLGSSCMFPRNSDNPIKEENILTGKLEPTNEGYALAKISILKLCEFINNKDNTFHYKTIIPCNLYGRYDKFQPQHSHMLPAVIRKIHNAKSNNISTINIWGNGTARREFMYAGDLADFISKAVERFSKLPNILNVGVGIDYSIDEYYKIIANIIGYNGEFKHDLTKPVGMNQKLISIARLQKFGWQFTTSINEGIRLTYGYYKNVVLND